MLPRKRMESRLFGRGLGMQQCPQNMVMIIAGPRHRIVLGPRHRPQQAIRIVREKPGKRLGSLLPNEFQFAGPGKAYPETPDTVIVDPADDIIRRPVLVTLQPSCEQPLL